MKSLKIRVNNEAESREIQNILESKGFKKWEGWSELGSIGGFIWTDSDMTYCDNKIEYFDESPRKEITLPELRDMAVLKRNNVNDATHEDKDDPEFKYRLIDNHWYVITDGNPVWRKDSIDLNEAPLFIKPIEKTMKEYLDKKPDGSYELVVSNGGCVDRDWIEIPEGAECLTKCKDHNGDEWLLFWKGDYKFCVGHDKEWFYFESGVSDYLNDWCGLAKVIWQRATHPEELPFIDDEPKYTNDEVKYMDESGQGRLQSINDQYAEIEEVRQQTIESTLSQRQSQYGCYEDVAHVTQQILSALRIGNYDKLPAPMKESLHMIASKMARIVNGDPEYLDNWHDIGGYSKLIEKLIKGE